MRYSVNIHSSICINDCYYFDPFQIAENRHNAKIVFITHSHYDHLEIESIRKVANADTLFVCPYDCVEILIKAGFGKSKITEAFPNREYVVAGIKFRTIPAYNTNKKFHLKEYNWLGYSVQIEDQICLICGDTDVTDELRAEKADIMFVPIGGTYTMTAREAAELTNIIRPKVVVPVHYGSIVGDKAQEQEFVDKVDKDVDIRIELK